MSSSRSGRSARAYSRMVARVARAYGECSPTYYHTMRRWRGDDADAVAEALAEAEERNRHLRTLGRGSAPRELEERCMRAVLAMERSDEALAVTSLAELAAYCERIITAVERTKLEVQ